MSLRAMLWTCCAMLMRCTFRPSGSTACMTRYGRPLRSSCLSGEIPAFPVPFCCCLLLFHFRFPFGAVPLLSILHFALISTFPLEAPIGLCFLPLPVPSPLCPFICPLAHPSIYHCSPVCNLSLLTSAMSVVLLPYPPMHVSFSVADAVKTAHIGSLGCSVIICVCPLSSRIRVSLTNQSINQFTLCVFRTHQRSHNDKLDGPMCFVLVACSICAV